MTYFERKEKESHLLYLIEHKRLCSLEKTANDFECSIRTLRRIINDLRREGYEIFYCRASHKYILNK